MQGDSSGQPAHTPRELAGLLWGQHRSRAPFASIASLLARCRSRSRLCGAKRARAADDSNRGPSQGIQNRIDLAANATNVRTFAARGRPHSRETNSSQALQGALAQFHASGWKASSARSSERHFFGRRRITIDDVARAVGGVAAAFELIDDRGADYARLDAVSLIADNSWNAGVVIGETAPMGRPDTTRFYVGHLDGALYVDEQLADCGNSRDALSHPFAVVQWLANHLSSLRMRAARGRFRDDRKHRAHPLRAGSAHYRFEHDGLPPVELGVA